MSLLWIHLAVTWTLVGLIWTVQVVHYPLMSAVGTPTYRRYQAEHMRRITWLVGPLMLAELAAAAVLVVQPLPPTAAWIARVGLVLVVAVWLSTAFVQAPLHGRLAEGFDAALHRRLVRTNWMRTAAWTARGVIACALLMLGAS